MTGRIVTVPNHKGLVDRVRGHVAATQTVIDSTPWGLLAPHILFSEKR